MASTPAFNACWVLANGLSPICNSITSLPWPLRRLATARTSKAVSADSALANLLNMSVVRGQLSVVHAQTTWRGQPLRTQDRETKSVLLRTTDHGLRTIV